LELELQLYFGSPSSISTEGEDRRDMLEVQVKNPFLFKAKASQEVIPRGDSKQGPIPQQISAGQAEAIDNFMSVTEIGT
jgi:hypothetical protein